MIPSSGPFTCIILIDRILLFSDDPRILSQVNHSCRDSIENYAHDYWRSKADQLKQMVSTGYHIGVDRISRSLMGQKIDINWSDMFDLAIDRKKVAMARFIYKTHMEHGDIKVSEYALRRIDDTDFHQILSFMTGFHVSRFVRMTTPRCLRMLLDRYNLTSVTNEQVLSLIYAKGTLPECFLTSGLSMRTIILLKRAGFLTSASETMMHQALTLLLDLKKYDLVSRFLNEDTLNLYLGFENSRFTL